VSDRKLRYLPLLGSNFGVNEAMDRNRKLAAAALLAMLVSHAEACDGILSLTRTIDIDIKSIHMAERLYQSACSGKTLKQNWNAQAGIETMIEQVPFKLNLGGGGTKEKAERFCSTFEQWRTDNSQYYNSAISTPIPAIDAWLACRRLQSEGVFFSVEPVRERVGFSVRRGPEIVDF
jgi:hypothetical protein